MSKGSDKPILLMTGASGLIGAKLIQRFINEFTIVNLDIAEGAPLGADFIKCDLTSDKAVKNALDLVTSRYGTHITSVFHLAAYYDFSGAKSPLYQTLTVEGSKHLINGLQDFNVEQFVFSSTNLVMKPVHSKDQLITEQDPLLGKWPYPQSKIATEKILKEQHKKIPLVILRIAGGYDEQGHSPPLCNQIANIFENRLESRLYPGDKNLGQAFIHLDDIVEMFAAVLNNRKKLSSEEIFFVAEPTLLTYEQLQQHMARLIHKKKWHTFIIPKFFAKFGSFLKNIFYKKNMFIKPWMIDLTDDCYPLSMKKAKTQLHFQPKKNLTDTLPKIISFLKSDPKKFYVTNKLSIPLQILKRKSYERIIDVEAVPHPWRYNPSSWRQRIPICIFASIAVIIAVYMSLYQMRLITNVWDPVFGDQTKRVLDSDVSHQMMTWLRIPDALLGALAYLGDIIFALSGSTRRWQFRPWLVIIFGIDVIPLGIVSIILVFMQGLVVKQWCFLCLTTAGISIILIVLAFDEVWTCCKFLYKVYQKTKSKKIVWQTLWGISSPQAHEVAESMIRRD